MSTAIAFLYVSAFLQVLAHHSTLGDECCPKKCVCSDSRSVTCKNLHAFPKLCNGTEIVTIRNSDIKTLNERDKLPVSVRHLTVQNSQTTSIAESFFPRGSEVTVLFLANNDILEANWFKNIPKLANLDLSSNRISKFERFPSTIHLTDLKLNGNKMSDSEVSSALCKMERTRLRNLHLDGMGLEAIPQGIINCKDKTKHALSLSFLSAAKNKIKTIPRMVSMNLIQLRLASNDIQDVPSGALPPSLTYLIMANNPLTSKSLSSISALRNLKHLDLAGVNYRRFPTNMFRSLSKLEFLSLMRCNITKLNVSLNMSLNLKSLSLQSNRLTHVPVKELSPLIKLENLFLDRNKIAYIEQTDKTEQFLYHLKKLSVSGNPFYCGCPILWFSKWLRSPNCATEILNQPDTLCLVPFRGLPLRNLDLKDCDKGLLRMELTLAAVASMIIVGVIIGIMVCCCRKQQVGERKFINVKRTDGYETL